MRIHEYPLAAPARLAYTVRLFGLGMACAGALGFLLALGAAITLTEAFGDAWREFDLDPLSRSLIPLYFVACAVGLLTMAVADSAYKWLLGMQLSRAAVDSPELVPSGPQHQVLSSASPFTGAVGALWSVFGVTAFVAIAFFAILGESSDDEVAFVAGVALGSTIAAAAMVGIIMTLTRAGKRRWSARLDNARVVWSRRQVREAEERDRARRPRGEKVGAGRAAELLAAVGGRVFTAGLGTVVAGSAVGLLGVMIRQPCRHCDERSYDNFGEALIANLALAGATITALGLAVLVIGFAATGINKVLTDGALRRLDGAAAAQKRPAGVLLQQRLGARSVGEDFGILLAGIATSSLATRLSFDLLDYPVNDTVRQLLLVVGIAGSVAALVTIYGGAGYNGRFRSRLRELWAPADVPPPKRIKRRG